MVRQCNSPRPVNGEVVKREFWLADVQAAITAPVCMVADWGAVPRCKYFQVLNRPDWVLEFQKWLRDPHEDLAKMIAQDKKEAAQRAAAKAAKAAAKAAQAAAKAAMNEQ